jgi:hypothetical protein
MPAHRPQQSSHRPGKDVALETQTSLADSWAPCAHSGSPIDAVWPLTAAVTSACWRPPADSSANDPNR